VLRKWLQEVNSNVADAESLAGKYQILSDLHRLDRKMHSSDWSSGCGLTSGMQRSVSPTDDWIASTKDDWIARLKDEDLPERKRSQGIIFHRMQELVDRTDREFDQLEDKLEEDYIENLRGSLRPASMSRVLTSSPAWSRLAPTNKEDVNRPHSSASRRSCFTTGGSNLCKPSGTHKPMVEGMPPELQAGTSLVTSFPIQRSPRPVGGRAWKDAFYGVAGRPRCPDPGWQVSHETYDDFQEVNHSSCFSMAPGMSTPRCDSSCSTRRGDNKLPPKPWTRWQAKQQAPPPRSAEQSARGCRSELDAVMHNRRVLFAETNKGLMGRAAFVS